ncbi:MAG: hypothetical protein JWP63_5595 [Candidatus Solibacter sp.]|nr:hypothetical protein [Candidatus Solibacter sp.]
MALGAQRANVIELVIRGNLMLAGAGMAIGFAIALGCSRFLSGMLFGVSAADPLTFVGAAATLTAVATAASYIPARRTTRIDPMTALRNE